jgi:hypothetical protein
MDHFANAYGGSGRRSPRDRRDPRNPFKNNGQLPNFNGSPFLFPELTHISGTGTGNSINGSKFGANYLFPRIGKFPGMGNGAQIDLNALLSGIQGMVPTDPRGVGHLTPYNPNFPNPFPNPEQDPITPSPHSNSQQSSSSTQDLVKRGSEDL